MARLPEPIPDEDRLKMIEGKHAGKSFDELVQEFGGKYKRGKIVGEIERAEEKGELQPQGNSPAPPQLVAAPVLAPRVYPSTRSQPIPAPGWTFVNRSLPSKLVYHHTTEPTVIFTQAPAAPQKPFDLIEYVTKKAIDAMFERAKTPLQPLPPQQSPANTQDQIGILQKQFDQMQDRQRLRAEQEQRRQEELKAEEKKQAEERAREDAENQKKRAEMGESVQKLTEETNRVIQTGNAEVVSIFQKCISDNARTGLECARATHDGIINQQELKDGHEAMHFAAVRDELQWFRDAGKIVDNMIHRQPKRPQNVTEQSPAQTYRFIRDEVHEEMQRRAENARKKRNQELIIGTIGALMIVGKEIAKNLNNNQT